MKAHEDFPSRRQLPHLDCVAASIPPAARAGRDTLEVSFFMVKEVGDHFVLLVKGDALITEGLHDGDRVIFKKQVTALNGQTVVALINNQATIKKYFKRENQIELVPANPAYETTVLRQGEDFKIEGILAGVIRKSS